MIVLLHIINNSAYIKYYHDGYDMTSKAHMIGHKTRIVSTYATLIMGFFQAASIFELFLVLGQINKAALENSSEAKPPSLIGIFITYLLASLASLTGLALLIFWMVTYER